MVSRSNMIPDEDDMSEVGMPEDFIDDDVDETNYDPYSGCDTFECDYLD